MLRVISDGANVLIAHRKIDAREALGVGDRASLPQLVPDRIRVFDKGGIEMVEIAGPIGNGGAPCHAASPARSISIANSGQLALASQALPSRVDETRPSAISWASPKASTSKSSGASATQRAGPWQ